MLSGSPKPGKLPKYSVSQHGDVFCLMADTNVVKSPAGRAVEVPTKALAARLVEEWSAQTNGVKPHTMPMTQLAMTALDLVAPSLEKTRDHLADTIHSDALCHWDEEGTELYAEQAVVWKPWLIWAEKRLGTCLRIGHGLRLHKQTPEAVTALRAELARYDAFELAGLQQACSLTSSCILGLALFDNRISPDEAVKVSELECLHQMKRWGEDAEITGRHATLTAELTDCNSWFQLIRAKA